LLDDDITELCQFLVWYFWWSCNTL